MSDDAYGRHHGIAFAAADVVDSRVANAEVAGATAGEVVTRGDRVSIVFVRKLDG